MSEKEANGRKLEVVRDRTPSMGSPTTGPEAKRQMQSRPDVQQDPPFIRNVVPPDQLAAEILKTCHLSANWQMKQGIPIDESFVAQFDNHPPPVDVYPFDYVRQSLFFTGHLRDPLGHYGLFQPYEPAPEFPHLGPEILWAECLLTAYVGADPDSMHQSLLQALGGASLANEAVADRNSCARKLMGKNAGAARLPVEQVRKQSNALGFNRCACPPAGILINGEDESYRGTPLSSISGYVARYYSELTSQSASVITFVAGKNAHREASDKLAGVCGMLRSLSVQLLLCFEGHLNFSFLNDQYLCEIYKGSFVALLYLFKHLICTIAWQRGRVTREEVCVVIDGINYFEGAQYIQEWSNFVLQLRELVYRIMEVPDANSACLRMGVNFKYVLIHPTANSMSRHTNEYTINRSLAPAEVEKTVEWEAEAESEWGSEAELE